MQRKVSIFPNQNSQLIESYFPYLPQEVDIEHIFSNGKLLPEDKIEIILEWFAANPDKKKFRVPAHWQPQDTIKIVEKWEGPFGKRYQILCEKGYKVIKFLDRKTQKSRFGLIYQKNNFEKGLGKGNAVVGLMQDIETGEFLALKMRKNYSLDKHTISFIQNEMMMLDYVQMAVGEVQKNNYYKHLIIMKLAHGMTVKKLVKHHSQLPAMKLLSIALQILKSIAKIHQRNILHRDIKPNNMLYHHASGITLIDFEMAHFGIDFTNPDECVGTRGFFSRDVEHGRYNEKTEVYAIGKTLSILFKLSKKKKDYVNSNMYTLFRSHSENIKNHPIFSAREAQEILAFLARMTSNDSNEIPTINECIEFFELFQLKYVEVLDKVKSIGILDLDEYYGSDEIKKKSLVCALKVMDEVWFYDANRTFQRLYFRLYRELENSGIHVGAKLFHLDSKLQGNFNFPTVPNSINEADIDHIHSFFMITKNKVNFNFPYEKVKVITADEGKSENEYKDEVNRHLGEQHLLYYQYLLVKNSLKAKLAKLSDKYDNSFSLVNKRKNLLTHSINQLEKTYTDCKLNLIILKEILSQLQHQMIFAEKINKLLDSQENYYKRSVTI